MAIALGDGFYDFKTVPIPLDLCTRCFPGVVRLVRLIIEFNTGMPQRLTTFYAQPSNLGNYNHIKPSSRVTVTSYTYFAHPRETAGIHKTDLRFEQLNCTACNREETHERRTVHVTLITADKHGFRLRRV